MTIQQVKGWIFAPNGQLNLCDYYQAEQFRKSKLLIRTIWLFLASIRIIKDL